MMARAEQNLARERRTIDRVANLVTMPSGVRIVPLAMRPRPRGTVLMPWADGEPIESWARLSSRMLRALQELHERLMTQAGIVRIDTHTSNLRLQRDDSIVVFDWSSALFLRSRIGKAAAINVRDFLQSAMQS